MVLIMLCSYALGPVMESTMLVARLPLPVVAAEDAVVPVRRRLFVAEVFVIPDMMNWLVSATPPRFLTRTDLSTLWRLFLCEGAW